MNSNDQHTDEGNAVPEVLVKEMTETTEVIQKSNQAYCEKNPDSDVALINAQAGMIKAKLMMFVAGTIGVFVLIMVLFSIWVMVFPEIYGREPNLSDNGLEFLKTIKDIVVTFFKVLS